MPPQIVNDLRFVMAQLGGKAPMRLCYRETGVPVPTDELAKLFCPSAAATLDLPQVPLTSGFAVVDKAPPVDDPVRPAHYRGDLVMRIIETFGLQNDFYIANAIKYLLRHLEKGHNVDIEKAIWYLQRKIERAKGMHTEGVK